MKPLSDQLKNRIRERLLAERQEGRRNARMGRDHMAAISDGRVSALEWVLREAESLDPLDPTCPRCGHIHEGAQECGVAIGPGRLCRCEMEVTA